MSYRDLGINFELFYENIKAGFKNSYEEIYRFRFPRSYFLYFHTYRYVIYYFELVCKF